MTAAKSDSQVFHQVARRASTRFHWRWQETQIAGRPSRLAVAADPDGMLLDACRRQDRGEAGVIDPFWATTWRAATGLDHYLTQLNLRDARILELGCGTGHAGIAAAHCGAHVTLTDGVTDPLLLVRLSAWNLTPRCQIRRLRFGKDKIAGDPFPLIIGSDITYLRELWPELNQCLKDHLAPGGQVLLSDPFRIIANEFRDWIQDSGWTYVEHRVSIGDHQDHPIRIMQLKTATPPSG